VARAGAATLRDHGGGGPPAVLIPSLINPPRVLDLDADVSLCAAVAAMGRRALLVDWGAARERAQFDLGRHVEALLLPLLRSLGEPAALIGYCLGGTMAIAAANLERCERIVTIAAPWRFSAYPEKARIALQSMWSSTQPHARALGVLPMEVLQSAFWSLDPERTVRKFAGFAALDTGSAEARRFVAIEDWANEGEPLPYRAARELIEDHFGEDVSGRGAWTIGGEAMSACLAAPVLHLLAARDRIAPADTAAPGESVCIDAGHVGMVVGSARLELHRQLAAFLTPLAAARQGH
jgi:polyhydroxyalkanoate synthase